MKPTCRMVKCHGCSKDLKAHLADYTLSTKGGKLQWVPVCTICAIWARGGHHG